MLLKVDCLPNAVGKQPSIPLIYLGRKWTLNWWWWWWWWLPGIEFTTCSVPSGSRYHYRPQWRLRGFDVQLMWNGVWVRFLVWWQTYYIYKKKCATNKNTECYNIGIRCFQHPETHRSIADPTRGNQVYQQPPYDAEWWHAVQMMLNEDWRFRTSDEA